MERIQRHLARRPGAAGRLAGGAPGGGARSATPTPERRSGIVCLPARRERRRCFAALRAAGVVCVAARGRDPLRAAPLQHARGDGAGGGGARESEERGLELTERLDARSWRRCGWSSRPTRAWPSSRSASWRSGGVADAGRAPPPSPPRRRRCTAASAVLDGGAGGPRRGRAAAAPRREPPHALVRAPRRADAGRPARLRAADLAGAAGPAAAGAARARPLAAVPLGRRLPGLGAPRLPAARGARAGRGSGSWGRAARRASRSARGCCGADGEVLARLPWGARVLRRRRATARAARRGSGAGWWGSWCRSRSRAGASPRAGDGGGARPPRAGSARPTSGAASPRRAWTAPGFAQAIYRTHGVELPRDSDLQARAGEAVEPGRTTSRPSAPATCSSSPRSPAADHRTWRSPLGGSRIIHSSLGNGGCAATTCLGAAAATRRSCGASSSPPAGSRRGAGGLPRARRGGGAVKAGESRSPIGVLRRASRPPGGGHAVGHDAEGEPLPVGGAHVAGERRRRAGWCPSWRAGSRRRPCRYIRRRPCRAARLGEARPGRRRQKPARLAMQSSRRTCARAVTRFWRERPGAVHLVERRRSRPAPRTRRSSARRARPPRSSPPPAPRAPPSSACASAKRLWLTWLVTRDDLRQRGERCTASTCGGAAAPRAPRRPAPTRRGAGVAHRAHPAVHPDARAPPAPRGRRRRRSSPGPPRAGCAPRRGGRGGSGPPRRRPRARARSGRGCAPLARCARGSPAPARRVAGVVRTRAGPPALARARRARVTMFSAKESAPTGARVPLPSRSSSLPARRRSSRRRSSCRRPPRRRGPRRTPSAARRVGERAEGGERCSAACRPRWRVARAVEHQVALQHAAAHLAVGRGGRWSSGSRGPGSRGPRRCCRASGCSPGASGRSGWSEKSVSPRSSETTSTPKRASRQSRECEQRPQLALQRGHVGRRRAGVGGRRGRGRCGAGTRGGLRRQASAAHERRSEGRGREERQPLHATRVASGAVE